MRAFTARPALSPMGLAAWKQPENGVDTIVPPTLLSIVNSLESRVPGSQTHHRRWSPVSTVLGAILVALLVYFLVDRIRDLEGRVGKLNERLEESAEEIIRVQEAAKRASMRATQAEERAERASLLQGRTEMARNKAESQVQQARQEALDAKREAESVTERARRAEEEAERTRKERAAEMERLRQALSQIAETRRTALGLVMNLGSDSIQFGFDKANLRSENRELLSRIVGVLLTSSDFRIYVHGHTDNIGTQEYNQKLSERRAEAVLDYLVEAGIGSSIDYH